MTARHMQMLPIDATPRIFVVDDEAMLTNALCDTLSSEGYVTRRWWRFPMDIAISCWSI